MRKMKYLFNLRKYPLSDRYSYKMEMRYWKTFLRRYCRHFNYPRPDLRKKSRKYLKSLYEKKWRSYYLTPIYDNEKFTA